MSGGRFRSSPSPMSKQLVLKHSPNYRDIKQPLVTEPLALPEHLKDGSRALSAKHVPGLDSSGGGLQSAQKWRATGMIKEQHRFKHSSSVSEPPCQQLAARWFSTWRRGWGSASYPVPQGHACCREQLSPQW